MRHGRPQFRLGSLMMLIAFLAVGLAYPESLRALLEGAALFFLLIAVLALLHWFFTTPFLFLVDALECWVGSKCRSRPPAERTA